MSYNVIAIIPLSLCCITKLQSKKETAAGNIKEGRRLGVCAVYLVIGAIVFALMMAMFLTGIMIPVQRTWLCYYEGRFIYSTAIIIIILYMLFLLAQDIIVNAME